MNNCGEIASGINSKVSSQRKKAWKRQTRMEESQAGYATALYTTEESAI